MEERLLWIMLGALVFAVLGSTPASAQDIQVCPINMKGLAGLPPGQALRCACTSAQMRGSVWGGGRYTTDSSVCRAPRHAGVVSSAGGVMRV